MAFDPYRSGYADPYALNDQASLLESLGGATISGLSYAGGLLDKLTGARALRGLLGGRPEELLSILPGSDTFGLTNEQNAVSGRDLLESAGVLGANQPGLDFGDVGGFLAEVALDPSAWASFGASTLGKKLLPEAAQAGLQTLGRIPQTPTRVAARGLDELGIGISALDSIPGLGTLVNRGPAGATQSFLDNTQTGRDLRGIFQPEVMNTKTSFGQDTAKSVWKSQQQTRADVREGTTDMWSLLKQSDELGKSNELRAAIEGATPASDNIAQAAKLDQTEYQDIGKRLVENGALPAELQDASGAGFAPRGYTKKDGFEDWGGGTKDPLGAKRKEFLKHIRDDKLGATGQVQQIIQDPNLLTYEKNSQAGKYIAQTYGDKFFSPKQSEELTRAIIEQEGKGFKGYNALEQVVKNEKAKYAEVLKTDPEAPPTALLVSAQGTLKNTKKRMTELAGYARSMTPEERLRGISDRHMLADSERYRTFAKSALNAQDALYDAVPQLAQMVTDGTKTTTVEKLLKNSKLLENDNGLAKIATSLGIDTSQNGWQKAAKGIKIPLDEAKDLKQIVKATRSAKETGRIGKLWDSYTSMFKMGVLTWPARFSRDQATGLFLNVTKGVGAKDYADAAAVMAKDSIGSKFLNLGDKSGLVKDAGTFKEVQRVLAKRGLENNPKNATDALLDLAYANEVLSTRTMETAGTVSPESTLDDMLAQRPGTIPAGHLQSFGALKGLATKEGINPFNVRGVGLKEPAKETKFAPGKWSEEMAYSVEGMNRLPLFIKELRKGTSAVDAARLTNDVHFDYRPESLTKSEHAIKRVVPFYTWSRRAVPYVMRELVDKPGGIMAQTVRAQRNLGESSDSYIPNELRSQTAFPIGGMNDKGVQKFVTGFGLPQEAVLENFAVRPTFGGSLEHLAQKAGAMLHPVPKGIVEYALGKQFFGGRELADLDSSAERVMKNIAGESPDIPLWFDQFLSNSPLTRGLNTARTLTDQRKTWGDVGLNLLTGARVSDVDLPKRLEAEIREASGELLAGQSRKFESLFVPKRTLETLEMTDPEWGPEGSKRRLYSLYQGTAHR